MIIYIYNKIIIKTVEPAKYIYQNKFNVNDIKDNARDYSRNYFIESNYLLITIFISWIGSWKCPCLQVADGFNIDGNL